MKTEGPWGSWRGAALVSIVYVYFLLFAQFGFLQGLAGVGIQGGGLRLVMGAMAAGGILASLLAPRLAPGSAPRRKLQGAFLGCALAACLSTFRLSEVAGVTVSLLIGIALGLLTVTLVTHLRLWIGARPLLHAGLGTGVGYLICNYPPLFDASPRTQAVVSAAACLLGAAIAGRVRPAIADGIPPVAEAPAAKAAAPPFVLVLACFTALVWLDSAAFFIIQHTPALKSRAWAGSWRLWENGGLHCAAALGSAWLLSRRGLQATLTVAFSVLACACLLLADPMRAALASGLYPVGVSLYSVALVAYPALLTPPAPAAERARLAGWIYAVAGWAGSALGIGMGLNLGHIPPAFVLSAALLFFSPHLWRLLRERKRECYVTAMVLAAAFAWRKSESTREAPLPAAVGSSAIELGRRIYISEGCIHCHSQYVRPNSRDVLLWGPSQSVAAVRGEDPPLIGNRRQGPDLSRVGDRRSAWWLKAHFIDPAALSYRSFMPSYAYLFRDERGDELVAYLASLGSPQGRQERIRAAQAWSPSPAAAARARHDDGAALFQDFCATCHQPGGKAREAWRASFRRLPPDLAEGPLLFAPAQADAETGQDARFRRIAEIVKFGLPGTDMPGHEYLSDEQVAAIAQQVAELAAPSGRGNGSRPGEPGK